MHSPLDAGAATREEAPRLVAEAAALVSPHWLPEQSGWTRLDELGEEHRRLLATRAEIHDERRSLVDRFKTEDEEQRTALRDGFRSGEPSAVTVTAPAAREAALRDAADRFRAINDALDAFVDEAIAAIEAEAPELLASLASRREGAAEQRREAERLLAEARAEEVRVGQLEEWVKRNAGIHERASFRSVPAVRFVGWDLIENFTPPPEPEEDGMGGYRPQLVDPPGLPEWDRERNRRRVEFDNNHREDES